ncbi:uncharacterized protein [Bactrocera oleae]|uniref:uncharacterized protein n=1 Tax=Bactrocera oleae TaxID=104688 RepID=UPI00387EA2B2
MEEFKFCISDLFEYIEEHYETHPEDESIYTLEIKRVELNAIYDKANKSYDAFRRTPQKPGETIDFSKVKEKLKKGHQLYLKCLGSINQAIDDLKTPTPTIKERASDENTSRDIGSSIHLPPCDTDIFYGDFVTWPPFRDMFTAIYTTPDKLLTQFWEVEEVPKKPLPSTSDILCEQHYQKTTRRHSTGRYVVTLPFKTPEKIDLGNSRHIALAQYLRNEKSVSRKPEIKTEYDKAINEYLELGHMTKIEYDPAENTKTYYLPHHAVIKPDRLTTQLRVVFTASCPTSNRNSLNDVLHTGPILQADLVILVVKWRMFRIVFNADIQKMYRQILVESKHTPFQRIVFRRSPNDPIEDFELQTVTFGINCAPYLAIRTLLKLADDVQETHPLAAKILRNGMYVDDVLAGAHDVANAKMARDELTSSLESAGFALRKWTSNDPKVLSGISQEHLLDTNLLSLPESNSTKTLGIRWNAKKDAFFFVINPIHDKTSFTKREELSIIAKLFDPAGWLSPVVVTAKIIMQQIWLDKSDWDESLKPLTLHR